MRRPRLPRLTVSEAAACAERLRANIERALRGKPEVVRRAVETLVAGGHLLLEDVPGVGKTTLAHALARSIDARFRRIQFTSDLLPGDLIGAALPELRGGAEHGRFAFHPGPIFAHVVLADEINRASPKVQSALLEAMSEGAVTVDGVTHPLPRPFFVVATQNPLEHHGTHPLPESQLDRFLMRRGIGYPDGADEAAVLREDPAATELPSLEPVLGTRRGARHAAARRRAQVRRLAGRLPARDRARDAQPRVARRRRLAARRDRAAALRAGARAASTAATSAFPTTCATSPSTCSATACCSTRGPAGRGPARRPRGSCARFSSACPSRSSRAPPALLRPPRTLRPTRAGWSFFALTFGVGFAALNTGNNLLYLVLSLMLAFLVLSGVLSESALRGIALRRRLPRELHEGAAHLVALEISNLQQRVPAFALVVEDRVRERGGAPRPAGRAFALRIAPGATERRTYRFRPPGADPSSSPASASRRAFRSACSRSRWRSRRPSRRSSIPRSSACRRRRAFGGARESGEQVRGPRGAGSDVGGLRDFSSGDPLRRIHWRATLRQRALLVREVESEHDAEVELRLRTAAVEPGEEFERRVRWVASEVVSLLDAGVAVALRTDHAQVLPGRGERQRAVLLAFLARVQPGTPTPAEAA